LKIFESAPYPPNTFQIIRRLLQLSAVENDGN
jgi:hypothetical protein